MPDDLGAFYDTWKSDRVRVNRELPEFSRGFRAMYKAVMQDGALTLREKELIATAISVVLRCDACIKLHARGCLDAGATREQVIEATAVAAMMQGGPGLVYVPEVLHVLDQFSPPDVAENPTPGNPDGGH